MLNRMKIGSSHALITPKQGIKSKPWCDSLRGDLKRISLVKVKAALRLFGPMSEDVWKQDRVSYPYYKMLRTKILWNSKMRRRQTSFKTSSRVFLRESQAVKSQHYAIKPNESICTLRVTQDMVQEEITAINANKSCGPDNIHPRPLKPLIAHISQPIALLLNKTMEYGKIPTEWKQANVSPISKKGQKHLAENYRPISLTSIVCKLMETFVKRKIMAYLIDLDLLSSKKIGFISGRSTTTQPLNDNAAA